MPLFNLTAVCDLPAQGPLFSASVSPQGNKYILLSVPEMRKWVKNGPPWKPCVSWPSGLLSSSACAQNQAHLSTYTAPSAFHLGNTFQMIQDQSVGQV